MLSCQSSKQLVELQEQTQAIQSAAMYITRHRGELGPIDYDYIPDPSSSQPARMSQHHISNNSCKDVIKSRISFQSGGPRDSFLVGFLIGATLTQLA